MIVGAKTKDMLILEDEMKAVAGNYYPCTDDGTYGHAGMVTTMIEKLVNEGKKYDVCVAIGPMIMMKFVCILTKKLGTSYNRQHEPDHGRRNGNVRSMPSSGWR